LHRIFRDDASFFDGWSLASLLEEEALDGAESSAHSGADQGSRWAGPFLAEIY
jgi:hypothetical protein